MSVPDLTMRGRNSRESNLRLSALNVRRPGDAALGRGRGGAVPVPAPWLAWAAPARLGPKAGSGGSVLAAPPVPAWPHVLPGPRHQSASAPARALAGPRRATSQAARINRELKEGSSPSGQGPDLRLRGQPRLSPLVLCASRCLNRVMPLRATRLRPGQVAAAPTASLQCCGEAHSARCPAGVGAGCEPPLSTGLVGGPQSHRDISACQGRIAPISNPGTTKRRMGS